MSGTQLGQGFPLPVENSDRQTPDTGEHLTSGLRQTCTCGPIMRPAAYNPSCPLDGEIQGTDEASEVCGRPVEARYVVRWDFTRYVPRTWQGTRQCAVFGGDNAGVTVTAPSADDAARQCGEANRLNPFYLTATPV